MDEEPSSSTLYRCCASWAASRSRSRRDADGSRGSGRAPQLADAVAARRRARLVSGLRGIARPARAPRRRRRARRDASTATARRRAPSTPRSAICAGSRSPRTTAICCTSTNGGSSARARACWACARAMPTTVPTGNRTLWLAGPRHPGRALGVLPDPDRARVLHGLDGHGVRRRVLPEPGRRDRERAPLRSVEPLRASTRCSRASSPTSRRCREPPRRSARRTRSRRSTSATR